jgi:hypothetical protein
MAGGPVRQPYTGVDFILQSGIYEGYSLLVDGDKWTEIVYREEKNILYWVYYSRAAKAGQK